MRGPSRLTRFGVALAFLILGSSRVFAQPAAGARPELVTDRPDYTESSDIVSPGLLQFESGMSYEGTDRDGVHSRSLTVPGALMRIGLVPRLELRLGADGFLAQTVNGE